MATNLPNGVVGVYYSAQLLQLTGSYSLYTASPSQPSGLGFSVSAGKLFLVGTPTARKTVTFTVYGSPGLVNLGSFAIVISTGNLLRKANMSGGHLYKKASNGHLVTGLASISSPSITTDAIPNVLSGSPYSVQLAASSGTTPYTWSLAAGAFPSGLSLSSAGRITGTSTGTPGAYSVTVLCADANGYSATRTYGFALTPSVAGSIEIHLLTYCNYNLGGGYYIAPEDLDLHVKDPAGYMYGRGRTYPAGSASPNGGLLSPYINSCNESLGARTDDEYVAWAANAPSGVYEFWGQNWDSYSSGGDVAIKMQIKLNGSVWWETQNAYLPLYASITSIWRLNTATGTVVIV
jgi:hypothetical protein